MVIEELRTSLVAMRVNSRAVVAEPVVRVGLVEQAAQVAQEGSAAQAVLVVQVAREVSAELVAQVDREAPAELVAQVDREAPAESVVQVARVVLAGLVVQLAALELRLVKAGPGHDPVGVVPERDPVAVPVKAKSVTATHHRALVRVPKRAEDLAAVAAATMRAPAATEAAAAWAAAE
jgi:hypothetical protein